ncbi:hypothetical protein F7725_005025 [Dissostichus mawsoni]|uniref:G-protein coupled receptors family 1 profile domain-containing protein n=1 Tax=Dissostichus mawsoni TaxID=36200 RepID=A0A7J5XKS9_DISMA|nr:hypothetical protein F7725_005025 [Dissostichus mawsoni]
MGDLSKDVKALQGKMLDLEARSRRNNLILAGLPEGKEAGGISPLLDKILRHFLKLSDTIPAPEIERAHRALRPIPDPGHPPRHIIIRFLRWSDKNEVFKTLASAKGKLTWDGHDLRMFQDFPMEIQRQRDSYRELRSILRKENLRHGILYPARLIVTINEETFIFKEPKEAEKPQVGDGVDNSQVALHTDMAANSSSNSTLHPADCLNPILVFTALYVVYILLVPLFIFVLYIGFQRWRKRGSATTTSHTDVFTFHMVTLELFGVVGDTIYCYGIYSNQKCLTKGMNVFSVISPGQALFHLLTCVERYLAVVHPVIYMRQRGGVRIRNISIGFLFALIRPGPGEGGGNRERVDQSKQRAFYAIMAIMAALFLRFLSDLVSTSLYISSVLGYCEEKVMIWSLSGSVKRGSAATMSHTDVFTFHMVTLELIGVVGYTIYCYGIYSNQKCLTKVGTYVFSVNLPGQTLFHLLTCVERYLAVVHPVIYLRLRQGGGVRIRTSALGFGRYLYCHDHYNICIFGLLLDCRRFLQHFSSLCSDSPRAGEGGGQRERVDQSKQRAFYTIMAIMAALLLRFLSNLVSSLLYISSVLDDCDVILTMWSAYCFDVPSSLVLPLMFLQRGNYQAANTEAFPTMEETRLCSNNKPHRRPHLSHGHPGVNRSCGVYLLLLRLCFTCSPVWSATWLLFTRHLPEAEAGGGVRIRNISIGCVWCISFISASLQVIILAKVISDLVFLVFSSIVVCFCSVSVLFVLIRPGPGEGGGNRERVDQSKQRAFYAIMAIMAVLLLRFLSSIVTTSLHVLMSGTCQEYVLIWSLYLFSVPSSLVFPLLTLHRLHPPRPSFIFVLYIGFQRWRKRGSATTTSHTDVFTFHMVILELIGVVGNAFYCHSLYTDDPVTGQVGKYVLSAISPGQTLFHMLTCVERYLAVVHPVIYLRLRQGGGVRIRNISIGCVWCICFFVASLQSIPMFQLVIALMFFAISLIVAFFCSISVLFVLIRPGPGEGGGKRERVDHSKQRALHTMMAITAALSWRLLSILLISSLYSSPLVAKCDIALMIWSAYWFTLPSSLVLPLLFLQRAGKLSGCKH